MAHKGTQAHPDGGPWVRSVSLVHCGGVGFLAAWYYVMFFSTVVHYSTRNDITHLNSTFAFACCGMIAVFVATALWGEKRARLAGWLAGDRCEWSCAALIAVGTGVLSLIEHDFFEQPWCSITSTVCGAGFACLLLCWVRQFFRSDVRPIAICLGTGLVAGAAIYLAVVMLPQLPAVAITASLPLGSTALLVRAGRRACKCDEDAGPASTSGSGIDRAYALRALATVGIISFAESFERAFFAHVTPVNDAPLYGLVFLGAMLLATGAACTLNLCFQGRHQADLVSRVSAVLFSVAFMVALACRDLWLVSDFAVFTISAFVTLLSLIILAQATSAYGLSENQSFGFGLGVAIAGILAGHFLGSLLTSFSPPTDHRLELAAAVGVVLSLASFLFLANGDVLARLTDVEGCRPTGPRRFGMRCQSVAERYGLSPKETEVMVLAAKGRTNERIQEALGISAGTVNTYFTRLYRKLDVHDRQEMLDVIEREG